MRNPFAFFLACPNWSSCLLSRACKFVKIHLIGHILGSTNATAWFFSGGSSVKQVLLTAVAFCVISAWGFSLADQAGGLSESGRSKLLEAGIDKLLFVKRDTYQSSHFYTDFIDGCRYFGGNICVLDVKSGTVREVVPSMREGIFDRYDLSFDGKRIVFGWKRKLGEGFRIYEVGVDGEGLRQLTFPPANEQQLIERYDNSGEARTVERYFHHTDDMHPCYLPDGGICFVSTRCQYDILCDGGYLTTAVLYRIDGDGQNMEKLTNSSVSEFSPSMMPDGRILYTRWEYVDKGSLCVKALWAIRPDGTGSTEIFGNNHNQPPCFLHGRAIPGHQNMFVCLGTPHFPQAGYGTVIRIDTNYDIRTRKPMTYITPDVDIRGGVAAGEGGWDFRKGDRWVADRWGTSGRLYMDPYPLSKDLFLVSCKYDPKARWNDRKAWELYLLDSEGNHMLIYRDPKTSCWEPMPLRPRPKPPVLKSGRDEQLAKANLAACVVADIYRGMEGVKRGTIKYIRINEQVPRPWELHYWADDYAVSKGTHMGLKVQHGIVPVEEDGSAYFVVPADKNIFFQALDANYMEVQRERTYVNYRPGEIRSCVGCHEKPKDSPFNASALGTLAALRRAPSKPGPQPGEKTGQRVLHYPADVQPILDRHCVRCHSGDEPAAGMDLTGELTERFSRSYENLINRRRRLMRNLDEDTLKFAEYMPPYSLGSHASKLIRMLREGHNDVKLSDEEMIRLITWVDSNAQYYGSYYGYRDPDRKGERGFRPVPSFADAISMDGPSWGKGK